MKLRNGLAGGGSVLQKRGVQLIEQAAGIFMFG